MQRKRKIIVYTATSADGYIARTNGSVEWLDRPRSVGNYGMGAFLRSVDTIVWGRKTYDQALERSGGKACGGSWASSPSQFSRVFYMDSTSSTARRRVVPPACTSACARRLLELASSCLLVMDFLRSSLPGPEEASHFHNITVNSLFNCPPEGGRYNCVGLRCSADLEVGIFSVDLALPTWVTRGYRRRALQLHGSVSW